MKKTLPLFLSVALSGMVLAQTQNCGGLSRVATLPNGYIYVPGNANFTYYAGLGVSPEAVPYLNRLAEALRKQGTQVVFVIVPVNLDGYHSPIKEIRLTRPEELQKTYQQYIIGPFRAAGLDAPDLVETWYRYLTAHPGEFLNLRRDSHWSTTGIQLTADAVADYIRKTHPTLLRQLPTSTAKVILNGTYQRKGDIETALHRECAKFPVLGETLPKVTLENTNSDLLGGDDPQTLLVGTSYSVRDEEKSLGFDYFLEAALGTPVENVSLNGGGPSGAFINYFSRPNVRFPKLMIWETPSLLLNNPGNALDVLFLRQALPLVQPAHERETVSLKALPGKSGEANFKRVNDNGFVQILLKTTQTRKLNLTLIYSKGKEQVTLEHLYGQNVTDFRLEAKAELGSLKKVMLTTNNVTKLGDVTVVFKNY